MDDENDWIDQWIARTDHWAAERERLHALNYQEEQRARGNAMADTNSYGTTSPDDRERLLAQYAIEYHERCEAYDRTVCTGRSPRTDAAIPMTVREYGLINIHAMSVIDDIVKRTGVDRSELWRAISGR